MHALAEALAEKKESSQAVPGATFGLNQVTKILQEEIKCTGERPAPRILFVCQGDAEPQSLVAHIPMLVCTYNAFAARGRGRSVKDADSLDHTLSTAPSSARPPLHLVPLPSGAEFLLSTAAGLRRLSCVLLDDDFSPAIDMLLMRVSAIIPEVPRAPWLEHVRLEPTLVKHIATTAPTNMGAARAQKKASRAAHKHTKCNN
ncbi:ribonuclease P [Malassezia cuniculi]|uniref:Ribonuclease P n=1 Tax=Malassezia cuniculi TaxID=948313 RepID=A0AAF0EPT3_9BASI|nr:ribonuclease P [Malassezia cuniculi]